jgi:triosephosphate isomerase (TIM)
MKRKSIIAGNWKMNKTANESVDFIDILKPLVDKANCGIYLAVPFTNIDLSSKAAKSSNIIIGAQNINDNVDGAFTGEISGLMLKAVGAEFVIIGHSERRHVFNESDEFVNRKVLKAIKDDIVPILCVGELEKQREEKKTKEVLKEQLVLGLTDYPSQEAEKLIVAYEPVWAIGTGKSATPEMAQEAHKYIRSVLAEIFGKASASKINILYGGSVKPENIEKLIECEDIDGALIGGASLEPEKFAKIINSV